jgi:competence protein ComEC
LVVIPAATLILYLTLVTLLLPVTAVLLVKVVEGLNAILQLIATSLPYASIEGLQPTVLQTLAVYVILISSCLIFTLLAKR